jgi:hypothetical protein
MFCSDVIISLEAGRPDASLSDSRQGRRRWCEAVIWRCRNRGDEPATAAANPPLQCHGSAPYPGKKHAERSAPTVCAVLCVGAVVGTMDAAACSLRGVEEEDGRVPSDPKWMVEIISHRSCLTKDLGL